MGLATEHTETFEFFLRELSDLCGKRSFSPFFWTLPVFKDYVTHLEYIRSCAELWEMELYLELGAYQRHVFMDWRFVDDGNWELINSNLNGGGVESISAKWEEIVEAVKVK